MALEPLKFERKEDGSFEDGRVGKRALERGESTIYPATDVFGASYTLPPNTKGIRSFKNPGLFVVLPSRPMTDEERDNMQDLVTLNDYPVPEVSERMPGDEPAPGIDTWKPNDSGAVSLPAPDQVPGESRKRRNES